MDTNTTPVTLAAFVSPHGFGHAARACAVMDALGELEPRARFELFTTAPEWFFADSLRRPFAYHELRTDVGLVQRTPIVEDPEATLAQLEDFLAFDGRLVDGLARTLVSLACRLVLCDISPLGVAVARRAGLPSVLVENFTWDWIYQPYAASLPAFAAPIATLAELFAAATARVQTTPVCRPDARFPTVPPVSRARRHDPAAVRERLGLAAGVPFVLVTMGGIPWRPVSLRRLEASRECTFVVPGSGERPRRRGSLLTLPHRSGLFHPDLVHAAAAVLGKLGYSTVAEVHAAGVPFAYVTRPTFRESGVLARFARDHMGGIAVAPEELASGAWIERVPELLEMAPAPRGAANGAATAAAIVAHTLRGV